MPRTKVTPEIEERIIQLRRAGQSYKRIGNQLDLDWRTVKGVVNQVAIVREQDHWEAVTRQVDADLLRQHYSALMLVAQELRTAVNLDPIERLRQESQLVLGLAQSRAVHLARDHGMLPGIPSVSRVGSDSGSISLSDHGRLLYQSLGEHEPQLRARLTDWGHSWDVLIRQRESLRANVKTSLLASQTEESSESQELTEATDEDEESSESQEPTESTNKDEEKPKKQRLNPDQVEDVINAALTEALEHKLKRLRIMQFEAPAERAGEVIRRIRQDPYEVRQIYTGTDLDPALALYENVLKLALQQPDVWDRLDYAYQDVMRWTDEINQLVATLGLRGRPSGTCTFCPSSRS
jgi:hypothetical protein